MKKIVSIFCTLLVCSLCAISFCGCTQKTYKLVGLAREDEDRVVYYENLTDLEKSYCDEYENFTIKLGFRDDFVMTFQQTSGSLTVTYEYRGTYVLEENLLTLTLLNGGQNQYTTQCQYTNGRIIYNAVELGNNGVYLVLE